jgi:mediator of RNA polymerase II transcription subunit 13
MDGSDDEASQSDEELEDEDTPATSRPCTPPPSYLPLGPTLLQTQFRHAHLLPLSEPLRPPGSSISGSANQTAATPAPFASVPTPVSPAAGLGLTAEKWRTLEVVVNLLAKEAIENAVWRDAWSASNAFGKGMQGKKLTEIWVSDVKMVEKIFESLDDVREILSMSDLLGSAQTMSMPKVSLGKGDAIINILPPALRFWGKLGLGPKNGEKNATAYVLFADEGEQYRQREIASWLDGVRTAYEVRCYVYLKRSLFIG